MVSEAEESSSLEVVSVGSSFGAGRSRDEEEGGGLLRSSAMLCGL